MSAPEVDWVLEQFGSVVGSITAPLTRVDRDDSELLEGNIRDRRGDLQESNFVGATFVGRSQVPIGTEYDHDLEVVVGVRVEGLHHSEWGYIDPDGSDGIPFSGDGGLVDRLRDAILAERKRPSPDRPNIAYRHLTVENEAAQSSNYQDYYRHDFDVRFVGYEGLP